jgi:3-oxoacyl-[acyl-carrier-protein] synthase-3
MGPSETTASGPIAIRIAGTGHYLPGQPLDGEAVRQRLRHWPDPLPARVQDRLVEESGILTRHYGVPFGDGAPRETNTTMAAEAGRRALTAAGWEPGDVELLVVTTVVPDHLIPPTSTLVQEALEIPACAELEVSANCTAPYKGLLAAANQLRLGQCRRALVCSSQYVSFLGVPPWGDPESMTPSQAQLRWLLSDGAGAVALEAGTPDIALQVWTESRGAGRAPGMELKLGAAVPDMAQAFERGLQHVTQHARTLRETAIPESVAALEQMLRRFDIAPESIDHFIPEVPTMRFATAGRDLLATTLGLPASAWRLDLPTIGNVGGATFPITLDRLVRSDQVSPGDLIVSFAEESSKWMFAGLAFRWNP